MDIEIRIKDDSTITDKELKDIEQLFNNEYTDEDDVWEKDAPYGFSPSDIRAMAYMNGKLIGHVGAEKRWISVGKSKVKVAGIGGVLVEKDYRGFGIAKKLIHQLIDNLQQKEYAHFGYLGCREEVVTFYSSCGFKRINRTETVKKNYSNEDMTRSSFPILICSITKDVSAFPAGNIHLHGTAW